MISNVLEKSAGDSDCSTSAHTVSRLNLFPRWMALALLLSAAYNRTLGMPNDNRNPFGNDRHFKFSANINSTTRQATPQSRKPPTILFLIYCGGPSGRADMEAILQTWGKHLKRVMILSNTPHDIMPNTPALFDNNNDTASSWRISKMKILKDGGKRQAKESWAHTLSEIHQELQQDPSIHWIVRSDSDTWWNVHLLEERLAANILPFDEALAMGEFFPLVNFKWNRDAEWIEEADLTPSNGSDAYLTGGAGLVLTRKSVENLVECFPNVTLKSHTKEDVWFSPLAFACQVTLVHSHYMHQFPWDVQDKDIPVTLSVHHVAGDGRHGYAHPSYYEDILHHSNQSQPKKKHQQ